MEPRESLYSELLSITNGQPFRFEDYVTVVSGKEVGRRFNADSLFLFDFPMAEPLEKDGEIYTHCTRMYLSREGRVVLRFAWFFTDEGVKNKESYIRRLDKHVWYKRGKWTYPHLEQ